LVIVSVVRRARVSANPKRSCVKPSKIEPTDQKRLEQEREMHARAPVIVHDFISCKKPKDRGDEPEASRTTRIVASA